MIGKNNFLNIRYSPFNKWLGQTGKTNGFCDFETSRLCVRAVGILLMRSYRRKSIITVKDIISRYAPPNENHTDKYIRYICQQMNCFPDDRMMSVGDYSALVYHMQKYEYGKNLYPLKEIESIFDSFKIVPVKVGKS